MRKLPLALIAFALLLSAVPSEAKLRDKCWELGAFVGNYDHDSSEGITNGTDLGISVGFFKTAKVGVEGRFSQDNAEFHGIDDKFQRAVLEITGNFLSDRDIHTFPYIAAGVGINNETREAHTDPNGAQVLESFDSAALLTIGAGARSFFTDNWAIRYELRYFHQDLFDQSQDDYELSAGVSWIVGGKTEPKAPPPDADGDGVKDKKDKCPDTPKGATVNEKGCPADTDGDGVFDGIDQCPDTPKGSPVDEKGCFRDTDGDGVKDPSDKCPDTPKGAKVDTAGCPTDADGDGVFDGIDQCPDTPKGAKVDAKGCPSDTDGDKVYDGIDQCPDTPKGVVVDAKGCPVDSDKDGVFDGPDKCPDTPSGATVDAAGCPKKPDPFQGRAMLVLEGVTFGSNGSTLTPEARTALDSIAAALQDWPEVFVEVGGHTDSQHTDAFNLKLSQARADSVRDYLVSKGINPSRLTTKGYGESQPIADNKTADGRAKNRRVELKRLN